MKLSITPFYSVSFSNSHFCKDILFLRTKNGNVLPPVIHLSHIETYKNGLLLTIPYFVFYTFDFSSYKDKRINHLKNENSQGNLITMFPLKFLFK